MCSELFRIPYQWGGVPIFGFGVLLAVWAVVSVVSMTVLVRRQGWNNDTWSYVPVLLLFGATVVFLPRFFPGGLPVRGFGTMVLIGASSGLALATHRARQVGLQPELILSLAFWMFVCGIVGARAFFVIEYWETLFAGRPLVAMLMEILNFPAGGLVVYGAVFGACVAFLAFVRRQRLPTLAMADLIAPSLAVGLAFGRLGCLLNGCCYGGPSDLPWAVTFPAGSPPYVSQLADGQMYGFRLGPDAAGRPVVESIRPGSVASQTDLEVGDVIVSAGASTPSLEAAGAALYNALEANQPLTLQTAAGQTIELPAVAAPARSRPVHPTQIYSAINAGLLAWFLLAAYPFRRRDGQIFALLVTIYPVTRFVLEIIRTDEPAVFGTGLSISQNVSLLVFAGAVALWCYLERGSRRLVWSTAQAGLGR